MEAARIFGSSPYAEDEYDGPLLVTGGLPNIPYTYERLPADEKLSFNLIKLYYLCKRYNRTDKFPELVKQAVERENERSRV